VKTLTRTEEEETIISNCPDRSTYPEEKSVSRSGATPVYWPSLGVQCDSRPGYASCRRLGSKVSLLLLIYGFACSADERVKVNPGPVWGLRV